MELLQLRYFFDSAKYMSISKTAEKYMVPSTSVSASIRRLEKELGCRLFERLPNRIVLNDQGRKLQQSLTVIFEELDRTVGSISDMADDTREIRILVKALRSIITDRVIQYKNKHANTRFQLIADFDETNLDDYDIIVDTKRDSYGRYESFELCRQRILICAASSSPLCGCKLRLEQLAQEPFANMSQHGNHYRILMDACGRAGFVPKLVAQVNDSACFMKIIGSGAALGVSGELALKTNNSFGVTALNVTDFKEYQTVCVYYKKEAAYGNVRKFMDFLRDHEGDAQTEN